MSLIKKGISLIIVLIVAHGLPILSRTVSNSFYLSKINFEPMRQLVYVMITYSVQICLSIIALKICIRGNLSDAGFNLHKKSLSLKYFKKFILIWSIIVVVFYVIALNLSQEFGSYVKNICPPNFWNILNHFVGSVMFAGIGEEPLYRSFVVLVLIKYWDNSFKFGKIIIPHISVISGFIFMTAHIGYNVYPSFTITHLDPLQLLFTFILGIVWSNIFVKTRSLLCPILAHSSANGIQYTIGFITSFILK